MTGGCRLPSAAARSPTCGTSGGSRRAGGRGGRCAAATSTWLYRRRPQHGRLPRPAAAALVRAAGMTYAELHAHSCYSFLDGASQPIEVAERAAELGYDAFALTDHDGLCGSMEFARAARDAGLRPITGCEVTLDDGAHLTLLAEDRAGLPEPLPAGHAGPRRRPPGTGGDARAARRPTPRGCTACPAAPAHGHVARLVARGPAGRGRGRRPRAAGDVRPRSGSRSSCSAPTGAATPAATGCSPSWPSGCGCELVATGDPHAHTIAAHLLQDALVAIRMNTTLDACERQRRGNHESVLRSPAETAARFPARAVRGAERGRRALPFRPDTRPGLPLPRLRVGDRRVGAGRPPPHLLRGARAALRGPLPHPRGARAAGAGAGADRPPRPGRLLPAAPRHPGDGPRGRGARARGQRRPPPAARPAAAAAPASARSSAT